MKKILLIEDNDIIRNNAAEILELAGYTVIQANNGKSGVNMALTHLPDLIVCDIMMPRLDGYGVLHALQKNPAVSCTPFIFLTAKADKADFRKGMEVGADDYIAKPFSGTELLSAVDRRFKKMDALKNAFSTDGLKVDNQTDNNRWLEQFVAGRDTNHYKLKQLIYQEGNRPNRLYFIISGKVKTCRANSDGKELVTELYRQGDFLGYIALLEETSYRDTAVALEDTELAIIPKEDFFALVRENTGIMQQFARKLAMHLSTRENKLLGIAYDSLREKVASALLLIKQKFQDEDKSSFSIHLSRNNLAALAGVATESLVRTLSDFKAEKILEIVDGQISILNENLLLKIGGQVKVPNAKV